MFEEYMYMFTWFEKKYDNNWLTHTLQMKWKSAESFLITKILAPVIWKSDFIYLTDELYMALVYSTKAHANIVSIDFSDALKMPGVHGHVTHDDIPGAKLVGSIVHDEEMFASKTVSFLFFFFWQNSPLLFMTLYPSLSLS